MNQVNGLPLAHRSELDAASIVIELEAHDASRLGWRVGVPLATHQNLNYRVQTEFGLPSSSVLGLSPCDQLQGFTRLEEPEAG